jgi:hypothetical protein
MGPGDMHPRILYDEVVRLALNSRDRLYNLVIRVFGYRFRGPEYDSRLNQIF